MSSIDDKKSSTSVNYERTPSPPPNQQQTGLSLLQSVKRFPKILAWCLALTSGILLHGYDLVIVGNVSSMPEFQKDFGRRLHGKLIIPALWLGLWNIANPLGGIFGALAGGFVQDRVGRRRSLTIATVLSAMGVAVAYVSDLPDDILDRRAVFFAAKIIQGFATYMVMCTTQTYMSEVLPPMLRGPVLAFFPTFTLLGQLLGSIVVYVSLNKPGSSGYKNCFISQWPFSVLPLVVSIFMPESPAYLIRRVDLDAARKCQQRLVSPMGESESILEQTRLSIELELQTTKSNVPGYLDCFRGNNRRRTTIVIFAGALPPFFGLALLSKASYFMQVVGQNARNSLLFLQVGLGLGLFANLASMVTLANFGRRPLTFLGLIISIFLWTGMGIAGCFSGTVTVWYSQITLMVLITNLGLTTWPASYAFGAEASSLQLRAKSQGLSWLSNTLTMGVLGLVLPYIFNDDEGALGAKTGFIFTGFCVILLGIAWWIVPEMKDLSAMEIDALFEGGEAQAHEEGVGRGIPGVTRMDGLGRPVSEA
ncbi:general substrate transporter [Aspergillus undulatus]|uniref:general substrate transporter n=1 Tax=Aspergillus undulatus TaxID=1810928 RepID=UPI003CCD10E6